MNNQGTLELTRDGRFKISDEGYLVDNSGNKVLGENGAISLEDAALERIQLFLYQKEVK